MARCILEVDTSDVQKKAYALAAMLSEQEGKAMLYAAFKRTGGHTRQIMKKDLPRDYEIGATRVGQAVQNAKVSISNLGVNCLIPIVGKRGAIGSTYRATGGAHGWASMHRKYTITARIVKSGRSRLPEQMNNIGGQPPFRNYSAPSLNRVAFTREGQRRLPIRSVMGIAIPQMPVNRSEEDVQQDFRLFLEERIEHEFAYRVQKCR